MTAASATGSVRTPATREQFPASYRGPQIVERTAAEPVTAAVNRIDLVRALRRLPPKDRAAIYLRYYEDMGIVEVAAILRISTTAARSRIHRTLRKLRLTLTWRSPPNEHAGRIARSVQARVGTDAPRPGLRTRAVALAVSDRRPRHRGNLALAIAMVVLMGMLGVAVIQLRLFPRAEPARQTSSWTEDLSFSGEVEGRVKSAVPRYPGLPVASCTGRHSTGTGPWSAVFIFYLDGEPYFMGVQVVDYRGPGTYSNTPTDVMVNIQLYGSGDSWGADGFSPLTLVVDPAGESGTLVATLSPVTRDPDGRGGPVHIEGRWTCKTTL